MRTIINITDKIDFKFALSTKNLDSFGNLKIEIAKALLFYYLYSIDADNWITIFNISPKNIDFVTTLVNGTED